MGVIAYAFQIYFDFSGYSDMAIGLGRMFGFVIPKNFRSPYLSESITISGAAGTSRFPPGCGIICICRSAETSKARNEPI